MPDENEVYTFEAIDEEPAQKAVVADACDPDAELRRKLAAIQLGLICGKDSHNDHGDYDYRTVSALLEAVKPYLEKHGLILVIHDRPEQVGSWTYIHSVATLTDIETGAGLSADGWAREQDQAKMMSAPQLTGAAATYAAKRALGNLFAVDDSKADPDRSANTELPQRSAAVPQPEQPTAEPWPHGIKCRSCGRTYEQCTSPDILNAWYDGGWKGCDCGQSDLIIAD